MDIRTEVDIKNYVFKIFVDGKLFRVFEGNYPQFLLTVDLLEEGYIVPNLTV